MLCLNSKNNFQKIATYDLTIKCLKKIQKCVYDDPKYAWFSKNVTASNFKKK